jgi:hypothetical protein
MVGLLIGAFSVLLLSQPRGEREGLSEEYFYGSLSQEEAASPGLTLADGLLVLHRSGGEVIATLDSQGEPLELTVAQAGGGLRLLSLRETADSTQSVRIEEGRLALSHLGPGRVELRLGVAAAPLELRLGSREATILEQSVRWDEIPAR